MEEYEHFSKEFKKYWKTPRNTEVINQLQKDYDIKVQNVIRGNIERLEECIKTKTEKIITNKEYDIVFDCKDMRGLPSFEPICQGNGIINKPFVPDEYTNLKYLEKPLTNIGIIPYKFTETSVIGKNQFEITHADSDYDWLFNRCGYVRIRVSNT
jgi:hypothetical protein